MPRITDPAEIRALLRTDRAWAVYALGDLAPGFFEHCQWFASPASMRERGLALLYRAFEPPVLFTHGELGAVSAALDEIQDERKMYLSIRPEILPLLKARYTVEHETAMWRMTLAPAGFRPASSAGVERLGPADLPALQHLYADGQAMGEVPDFFNPDMVEAGVFFGVRQGEALVAAAGTHLVAPSESVGAVGNVYTRRDRRGRGLAGRVTSAVTAELLKMNLRTVALNVNQQNLAAVRVYEKLGFTRHCPFYEGVAVNNEGRKTNDERSDFRRSSVAFRPVVGSGEIQ